MKIAFAVTEDNGFDSKISDRLARAPFFIVIENDKIIETIKNPYLQQERGVGPKVISMLSQKGVDILVGPQAGVKAQEALKEANIKLFICDEGITVKDALNLYKENKLKEA